MITCPRRMYEIGPWLHEENLDDWDERGGYACCNFCGSLNPDIFMELMENGVILGPTDKNYKIYVKINDGHRDYKFYFMHLSEEQKQRFVELCNMRPRPFTLEYPGRFYVLPYFVEVAPRKVEGVNDG